ncbi:MAG TPA: hypothetical protein VNZ86_06705 [Bacteroidia bacterium]|jgi:hypothetical protein|nr:hypothetical protein [Bacteroidia bacterium]
MKYLIIKGLLVVSTALDAHSSWKATKAGAIEANPILSSHGTYATKGATIEFGITSATLLTEYLIERNHPNIRNKIAIAEAVSAGAHFGIAAHNYSLAK